MTTTAAAAFPETDRTSEKVISETAHVAYLAPLTAGSKAKYSQPGSCHRSVAATAWVQTKESMVLHGWLI